VGAYHFFTTGSPGLEQAENFIFTVPITRNMLPPVVDVEVSSTNKVEFINELRDFINAIEQHYGVKPIIYTMYKQYEEYISDNFSEYDIWIRDLVKMPRLQNDKGWTFWQFCNRGHVSGIDGYVDINVFYGSNDALKSMANDKIEFYWENTPYSDVDIREFFDLFRNEFNEIVNLIQSREITEEKIA
jgi:lysozyme